MSQVVSNNILITNNSLYIPSYKKFICELTSLQKRIYKATIYHNYKSVHQLQKLLLKSKSVKLVILLRLINDNFNINKLILKNLSTKFRLTKNSDCDIRCLPNCFSSAQLLNYLVDQTVIANLSSRVNSYLIYLCLKPEWEAKLINNDYLISYYQSNIIDKVKTILKLCSQYNQYSYKKFGNIYALRVHIDIMHNLNNSTYQYLKNKLNFTDIIGEFIKKYLTLYTAKNFKSCSINSLNIDLSYSFLIFLLKKIIMDSLGIEIYLYNKVFMNAMHKKTITSTLPKFICHDNCFIFFSNNKSEISLVQNQVIRFYCKLGLKFKQTDFQIFNLNQGFDFLGFRIKNSFNFFYKTTLYNILIQPSARSQLALLRKIKNVLYHKDYLYRLRPNTYLSLCSAVKKVNYLVKKWRKYYQYSIIQKTVYKQLNIAIQVILYKWRDKKKQKKPRTEVKYNLFNRLKIENLLVNIT